MKGIYSFGKEVDLSYEEAIEKVTGELKKEGFEVLTEIDVKDILKRKLDIDFDRYIILGACNPPFAHKSLRLEREIGLLLPCNVIVYEGEGKAVVSAVDPEVMLSVVDNPELEPIAKEVKGRLERVIENL